MTKVAYYMWSEYGTLPHVVANLPRHELAMLVAFAEQKAKDVEKSRKQSKRSKR